MVVLQSLGWEHYEVHEPEPHILLFKYVGPYCSSCDELQDPGCCMWADVRGQETNELPTAGELAVLQISRRLEQLLMGLPPGARGSFTRAHVMLIRDIDT